MSGHNAAMAGHMLCPRCGSEQLTEMPTAQGVLIDYCDRCKGSFLDRGEINYFIDDPSSLESYYSEGLIDPHSSDLRCPRDGAKMSEGGLISKDLLVDECSECGGLWFDGKELKKLKKLSANVARGRKSHAGGRRGKIGSVGPNKVLRYSVVQGLSKLPSLAFRSVFTLALLYTILFIMMVVAVELFEFPVGLAFLIAIGILFLQYLISPFVMDWTLRWFNSLRWVEYDQLPKHLADFIGNVCRENNMKTPRMGIIADNSPNAFTYGHTPNNARVVVTEGLFKMLSPEELEGVVAHELGHAKHWDILVMTLAAMIPMLLYYLYRGLVRAASASSRSRKGGQAGAAIMAVAVAAFVLYLISHYIVLWISRTREFYADRFGGQVTGNPNALASALVKIAYGLAGMEPLTEKKSGVARESNLAAVKALGIFDPSTARSLAVAALSKGTQYSAENLLDAMQWDLWNPWAGFYELASTHPLPANRIEALGDLSNSMGQEPLISFDRERPESYWDEFLVDVLMNFSPWILFLVGASIGGFLYATGGRLSEIGVLGIGVLTGAIGYLVKVAFSYRGGDFPENSVAGLLSKIKVSRVRPVPATLRGRIIGRGVPGLIWSEDLVLQDQTGFMFMDYRQPVRFIEFLFGLFRAKGIIGQDVIATGWYRRSPIPYFEMKTIQTGDRIHTSYVYYIKWIVGVFLLALGFFLLTFTG